MGPSLRLWLDGVDGRLDNDKPQSERMMIAVVLRALTHSQILSIVLIAEKFVSLMAGHYLWTSKNDEKCRLMFEK